LEDFPLKSSKVQQKTKGKKGKNAAKENSPHLKPQNNGNMMEIAISEHGNEMSPSMIRTRSRCRKQREAQAVCSENFNKSTQNEHNKQPVGKLDFNPCSTGFQVKERNSSLLDSFYTSIVFDDNELSSNSIQFKADTELSSNSIQSKADNELSSNLIQFKAVFRRKRLMSQSHLLGKKPQGTTKFKVASIQIRSVSEN
jgi:hypothetical protein